VTQHGVAGGLGGADYPPGVDDSPGVGDRPGGADDPPGVDTAALCRYLDREHPALVGGPLRAELIPGGRSNLTYTVTDGARTWVLRRPPLAHVLATAHDMGREFRVMSALAGGPVPVPRTVLLCRDDTVIGAPFYLMEKVDGVVYRTAGDTAALSAQQARDLATKLIDVLARLHAVDIDAVGLSDFGRPDGYLERQVRRWRGQLDKSRSRDVPGIDELADRLAAAVPRSRDVAILHGDYRLDNVIVDQRGDIAAVLDWEMSTLGDPLADVGLLLVYWDTPSAMDSVSTANGFPGGAEVAHQYATITGRDLAGLDWYIALGFYKLAVVAEGIYFRHSQGKTVGEGFERFAAMPATLVEQGLVILKEP
jgi:aminoglycoside phosphotransferase (APT) family kinase protein